MSKQTNMVREKDILHDLCKAPCSVPDGYFDTLQGRLVSIAQAPRVSFMRKAAPAFALAASFAAIAVAGTLILNSTSAGSSVATDDFMYEQMLYADAIPATYSLEELYQEAAAAADMSLDEYIESINQ